MFLCVLIAIQVDSNGLPDIIILGPAGDLHTFLPMLPGRAFPCRARPFPSAATAPIHRPDFVAVRAGIRLPGVPAAVERAVSQLIENTLWRHWLARFAEVYTILDLAITLSDLILASYGI
jgi:hypothetical protein